MSKKQSNQNDQVTSPLQSQLDDLTAALQRERADAENLRRRHAADLASLTISAKADVVKELLPIIDNFERALKHVPEDLIDNEYVKGVQGIVKQFEKTLASIGVQRIATTGQPFDPVLHNAVSMEDTGQGKEIVSEELQSGYVLGDHVIRHAMVRVAK